MQKVKGIVSLIAWAGVITLLLFFVRLNVCNKDPHQISRDCRNYNIEVATLEGWEEKISNQKLKVLGFSGWSICGEEYVRCADLNKSFHASVIKIYGIPKYVLEGNILTGSIGYEIRDTDCIISESLAQILFGSTDIQHEKVILDGKIYSITGVIKNNHTFICLPLKEGKVEHVEIILESRRNADMIISALLN